MEYQVKAEKVISRSVSDVFQALKEGRLFMNCGADSRALKIDFRVGGKYHISFKNKTLQNFGEFVEIVPLKKIVFTWCQTFGEDQKPDTTVTIELFEDGPKTKMVLLHTGFRSQEMRDSHQKGWDGGIVDFAAEIEEGRLYMLRTFDCTHNKLYEACKNPESFFAHIGDIVAGKVDFRAGGTFKLPTEEGEAQGQFLEIVPNERIQFSWLSGCSGPLENSTVRLSFEQNSNGTSSMKLIHEGLTSPEDQRAHRRGWEHVFENLRSALLSSPT